ncbi:hypothetical protein FC75_GL001671 [Lacticaseibacillus camelliae DSM 22697 = JCM 13995]|uniref:Gram-positive cocci surface proteins LPxTG domain-containing protein n=2 Tax=Lacticaseibacillus camelliae TaxID=381742 RepID=A0A0R2FCB8_9LACO|nr:hypothetical protein FC75_GL001671 [Lacticaseibacillus camelliae DSM 22697 = JCM 13995]
MKEMRKWFIASALVLLVAVAVRGAQLSQAAVTQQSVATFALKGAPGPVPLPAAPMEQPPRPTLTITDRSSSSPATGETEPLRLTVAGLLLVVGLGLYVFWRKTQAKRALASAAQ